MRIRFFIGESEMIETKKENGTASIQKAQKHVKISLEVRDAINKTYPKYCVYLATHAVGRHVVNYQKIEEESGENFWMLPFYSQISREGKLKEPDLIATDGNVVKYLIEVKWGAIEGCSETDAFISENDRDKIKNAHHFGKKFKIRGPVIKDSKRYDKESRECKYFDVDKNIKFILVSDFQKMKDVFPSKKYEFLLSQLKEQNDIFVLADIHEHVDDIPSLQEIIQLDC